MYRTCSELAEKKDETDQLLGLMKDKEDKEDEFSYNEKDEVPNLEESTSSSNRNLVLNHCISSKFF